MEMTVRDRFGIIVLMVLCLFVGVATPIFAQSGIALVQGTSVLATGSVTSQALAFNSNNSSGNFIAVCIRSGYVSAVVTVTDSQGNTYQEAIQT
ncbi:MAG TPA: hypothetical protein VNV41_05780, partial [Candidatus Acidoferrales bacterium]|nr:hypothetical protein [Candidatus Acidoferrales bacterium]